MTNYWMARYWFLSLLFVCDVARAEQPVPREIAADHAQQMAAGRKVFAEHVRGLLIDHCVHCHGGDFTESSFDLTTREGLLEGGDYGEPGIVPGDAEASWLYQLITHQQEPAMPQEASKLRPEEIAHIAAWINSGAPYDKPLIEDGDSTPWTERVVPDEAKQYWAFQPLQEVSPPESGDRSWVRGPIDAFIAAKHDEAGIEPNAEADRRVLLRRAYLDLLGIPPTPDEAAAFLDDTSPDAYANLIDRLLGSPHFGERWGRHWLDVARFAESHGFEQDYDRPHAYHYRDFVIKALNQDIPYDQFVRYQLAGDEIAPEDPLAMMATGFLGAGVYPTQITLREVEPSRYDAMDDMANTTGQAFLGMTIGCARCHDHKFDPIPQADYYRFVSTFVTTVRSDIEVEVAPVTPQEIERHEQQARALAAELEAFEQDELPARLDNWMKQHAAGTSPIGGWKVLPWRVESTGGTSFTLLEDGSVLASGENADFDQYTFTAETSLVDLTALRIEALTHPSMSHGGPGRAENGNFCLTEIEVTAASLAEPGSMVVVQLGRPRATHQQNEGNLSVASSIDNDPQTGWAVDAGGIGEDQAAAFRFAEPVGFPGGTKLQVRLVFQGNTRHNLGRPRLSVTAGVEPLDLTADGGLEPPGELLADVDLEAGSAGLSPDARAALLKWYRDIDPQWRKLTAAVEEHKNNPPKPKTETVMVTSEGFEPIRHHMPAGAPDFYETSYFLRRGDVLQKDGEAEPSFLQVLMRTPEQEARWQIEPPDGARTSYRRRAMADWMTDREFGAGHLLARVIVNRIWQHHFGQGIVATPNDFGRQAEEPSHPELLDYLAQELVRNGWRLKPIHKLIMTSAAYRQSSAFNESSFLADTRNRLVWRHEPRRLEAEAIRDSLLAVTGSLDERMYGPGTLDESMRRRGIYFMIKRSQLIPMLQLFDAPEALVPMGSRTSTTIGPQALWFLNNPHVRSWAVNLAERVKPAYEESPAAAVGDVYQIALSRDPDETELKVALSFLHQQAGSYQSAGKSNFGHLALADFCQSVLSLNEFIYID